MACITEAASGFPNASGHIPGECAMIPEVLGERGFNTYIVGKWHLCPEDEMNMASTKKDWPLGRGFERFYGFLGAETNQWYPDITYDNHPVEQPKLPEEGYHFSVDITDKAICVHQGREGGRARQAVLPVLRARAPRHAPHHVPKEWADKYKGKFDMGYEAYREHRLREPEEAGDRPRPRRAVSDQPVHRPEGRRRDRPGATLDVVRPWDSLTDDEKKLFCPHGRGLRGLPQPRRRRSSAACSTTSSRPASSTTR